MNRPAEVHGGGKHQAIHSAGGRTFTNENKRTRGHYKGASQRGLGFCLFVGNSWIFCRVVFTGLLDAMLMFE